MYSEKRKELYMKTKPNKDNKVFEVTLNKTFITSYGLKFYLDTKENVSESDMHFNGADVRLHLVNVGCVIYVYHEIDEVYYICDGCSEDCFEIYQMIEKGLCK